MSQRKVISKGQATIYIYCHKYEVGDVLLFDNFTTMHRAKANIDVVNKTRTNSRLLWRLSCKGKPRLLN